jgi:4-hydroxy-tetrahydrodipicolinate reductase
MGRAVVALLAFDERLRLAAAIETAGSATLGRDAGELAGIGTLGVALTSELGVALRRSDVVIDFSHVGAVPALARAAASSRTPMVVCTTGLDAAAHAALDALAKVAPVVVAANTSVGVTVLLHLAARAAELLGEDYDVEIVELHHRHKVDAPSGTALRLAEAVAGARGLELAKAARHGRSGQVGARTPDEIGIHALRGGDVIGEHTVLLAGAGERLELTHRAHARDLFARGALRAARWVVSQPPGKYEMSDVLGIPR